MTDPFLEQCGGWTPAPDVLTQKYGFESAYLWGRLRRLCQLGNGTYTISPEALGKRFGMSRRTVIDRLKAMIKDGYIEDLTPGVRNKAHTYSVKKGEDKILSGMQISHTEDDYPTETGKDLDLDSDVGMRNLHSESAEIAYQNGEGMQKLPNRYAKNAHPGMQNLHLNRESLETHKEISDKSPPNGLSPGKIDGKLKQEMVYKLSQICKINLGRASGKQKGQLGTSAEALIKTGVSPPQLDGFIKRWYIKDWRGVKGQAPEPHQVCEEWDRLEEPLQDGKNVLSIS